MYFQVGENVDLICDYELAGEEIYSVKWYKDGQEIFRWDPESTYDLMHYPGTYREYTLQTLYSIQGEYYQCNKFLSHCGYYLS